MKSRRFRNSKIVADLGTQTAAAAAAAATGRAVARMNLKSTAAGRGSREDKNLR